VLVPCTDVLATVRLYLADQRVGLGSDMKLSAIELKDGILGCKTPEGLDGST
jgi:hypothetical protein